MLMNLQLLKLVKPDAKNLATRPAKFLKVLVNKNICHTIDATTKMPLAKFRFKSEMMAK